MSRGGVGLKPVLTLQLPPEPLILLPENFRTIQDSGDKSSHPSLRPNPNQAPTQTLDLSHERVGVSPETWIDPEFSNVEQHYLFSVNPFTPELKKCILPTFQKVIVWVR